MPQTLSPGQGAQRGRAPEPCKRTPFAAVPVARRCRHGAAQRPRRLQTEQTAICKQLLGLNGAGAAAPVRAERRLRPPPPAFTGFILAAIPASLLTDYFILTLWLSRLVGGIFLSIIFIKRPVQKQGPELLF